MKIYEWDWKTDCCTPQISTCTPHIYETSKLTLWIGHTRVEKRWCRGRGRWKTRD